MAAGIPESLLFTDAQAPAKLPWPSRAAAYYGLAVIILATMLNFFDAQVFGMMSQRIKVDLHLSDEQLGFLIGPANIVFYVLVGIPMARLVDIYPRKIVLACGIAIIGGITALGGLAQNFKQLFSSRMLVGAGGSAHAPGAYSMLADYFPPERVPRAIGFLQLGFIGGNTLGIYLGGQLISLAAAWPVSHWMGLTMHGWQWILMMVGAPGLLISVLLLLANEPPRRGTAAHGKPLPIRAVVHEIWARRAVYLPLFIGLAFSATQAIGIQPWLAPFMIRTYGWNEAQIGRWLGLVFLVGWWPHHRIGPGHDGVEGGLQIGGDEREEAGHAPSSRERGADAPKRHQAPDSSGCRQQPGAAGSSGNDSSCRATTASHQPRTQPRTRDPPAVVG